MRLMLTLIEVLKTAFYYSSCQPNWSLFVPYFISQHIGRTIHLVLPDTSPSDCVNLRHLEVDLFVEPTIDCIVLSKLSFLFYTAHLIFFLMTAGLRFCVIMSRETNTEQEYLSKPLPRILFSLLVIFVTLILFAWRFNNQGAITRACLVPDEEHPGRIRTKPVIFFLVSITFVVGLLYVIMAIKVKRSDTTSNIYLVIIICYTLTFNILQTIKVCAKQNL